MNKFFEIHKKYLLLRSAGILMCMALGAQTVANAKNAIEPDKAISSEKQELSPEPEGVKSR